MKARSGKLGDFVMTLLLLLIGASLIYGSLFNPKVGKFIADVLSVPLAAAGVGAVLVLSVFLRWIGGCGRKKEAYIDFESEDGNVGIGTKAIQDFIERVGKEFAAVKSIESKLIQGKDKLDIVVGVRVLAGNKIPELSQVLQQRIRENVRESLGIEGVGTISIRIKEIIGAPEKPADSARASAD
jgi:uncharacterized alkaline shock family protein YloU